VAARAPARRLGSPPSPAAPAGRARPLPLGLPLTGLHLSRIARLEELVGAARYQGWGQEASGRMFVDVLDSSGVVERFSERTLHLALGVALAAAQGER
jgi:hypothetical protein